MKRFSIVTLFFIAVVRSVSAAETLLSAVEAVMAHSAELRSVGFAAEGARSDLSQARSSRYPRLSIRSSLMRGDNPVYVFGSLLEQGNFGPNNFAIDTLNNPNDLTNIKNALDVGFPVFTAFELSSAVALRELAVEQAKEQWALEDKGVQLQAIEAYLRVLLARDIHRRLAERIESSQKEIESARKLNARGLVLGSDFYAALAVFSGLKAHQIQADNQLKAAVASMEVLMGRIASGSEFAGAMTSAGYPLAAESELVSKAMVSRQEIKQARLNTSMAETSARKAGQSFLPTIDAFASLETNTEDFSSNPSNHTVGVRSIFPIGDPGYFARKSSARAQLDSARASEESVAQKVRLDVVNAYAGYTAATSALPLFQEMRQHAQKSLELFRPLYREGRQSILDVLRAEEALFSAERALLETTYQVHLGYARLAMATGTLDRTVVMEISENIGAKP